ncbi:MAG TPA: hypothetical protein VGO16_11365 [Pseudonocardiaceae bacterium]|jgi:hypothetical protein|nr:hypothetical protein [Pseudonocardiaceae bacterium]
MEITMTTGARYLPEFGPLAARGEFSSGCILTAPPSNRWLRARRFHDALINPIGTDLPVIYRMRRFAAEP